MIVGLFTGVAAIGGVQAAGRQAAAALTEIARERNWDCALLSLNDERDDNLTSIAGARSSFQGFARNKPRFLLAVYQFARGNPKLLFAAHPNLAPAALMTKMISENTRVIVGAHGIEVWRPLSALRRNALRRADVLIAPSADTARKLAEVQRIPASKVRTLPWPLDPKFLALTNGSAELRLPPGFPDGQIVLSVGRWSSQERYKGADVLIRAVSRLASSFPRVQLVLVGPGDDLPRLEQLFHNCGASERVRFFPSISLNELAACYAHADVFALPSSGEGFGLVFLEAMAFGKPIIGANAGGIADVVEHGREGLLVSPTVGNVELALRQLLSDSGLQATLGANGRKRVREEFTFESFQCRLRNIIDELIERQMPAELANP